MLGRAELLALAFAAKVFRAPDYGGVSYQPPRGGAVYFYHDAVLNVAQYSRLGQITGDPSTGKSTTKQWFCKRPTEVRIEAWAGMKSKAVLQELAHALQRKGFKVDANGTTNTII
jgi:hypothetical protein